MPGALQRRNRGEAQRRLANLRIDHRSCRRVPWAAQIEQFRLSSRGVEWIHEFRLRSDRSDRQVYLVRQLLFQFLLTRRPEIVVSLTQVRKVAIKIYLIDHVATPPRTGSFTEIGSKLVVIGVFKFQQIDDGFACTFD